jgi:hypothetical protein
MLRTAFALLVASGCAHPPARSPTHEPVPLTPTPVETMPAPKVDPTAKPPVTPTPDPTPMPEAEAPVMQPPPPPPAAPKPKAAEKASAKKAPPRSADPCEGGQ